MFNMLGGLGFGTLKRTCVTCGMKFPADLDTERMMHHLWRFHNERYHTLIQRMFNGHRKYLEDNDLNTLDELKDYCELKMIDYDINMECQK